MSRKVRAFTIMEFLLVVIIVAIVTAFAAPRYGKVIAKADERNMIVNLKVLRTALDMYVQDRTAAEGVEGWIGLVSINNALRLRILDTKANYGCGAGPLQANSCTATHPGGWALEFHDGHSNRRIHCSVAGTCPSCPAQPGDCG